MLNAWNTKRMKSLLTRRSLTLSNLSLPLSSLTACFFLSFRTFLFVSILALFNTTARVSDLRFFFFSSVSLKRKRHYCFISGCCRTSATPWTEVFPNKYKTSRFILKLSRWFFWQRKVMNICPTFVPVEFFGILSCTVIRLDCSVLMLIQRKKKPRKTKGKLLRN